MNGMSFWEILGLIFADDLLRYVMGAGGVYLLINTALAVRLSRRKIRKSAPPSKQLRNEILASLRTVVIFSSVGIAVVYGARLGIMRVYEDVQVYGWLYLWGSTILTILVHDAYFYWSHRIMHRPRLFKLFHRLHHRSHNPSPFTSYSFDPGEALVNALFLPLVLLIVPLHPIALFVFTSHMMLRNALGHCGYEVFPADKTGKPLISWLTTVTHHDLHHANARYNMGLYFSWWDAWMGTEHPQYHAEFARVAGAGEIVENP
jgi:Delta7-sterol 5-desaturase